jgi:hypothetical protein
MNRTAWLQNRRICDRMAEHHQRSPSRAKLFLVAKIAIRCRRHRIAAIDYVRLVALDDI